MTIFDTKNRLESLRLDWRNFVIFYPHSGYFCSLSLSAGLNVEMKLFDLSSSCTPHSILLKDDFF